MSEFLETLFPFTYDAVGTKARSRVEKAYRTRDSISVEIPSYRTSHDEHAFVMMTKNSIRVSQTPDPGGDRKVLPVIDGKVLFPVGAGLVPKGRADEEIASQWTLKDADRRMRNALVEPGAFLGIESANPFDDPSLRCASAAVPFRMKGAFLPAGTALTDVRWSNFDEMRRRALRDARHLAFVDGKLFTSRVEPTIVWRDGDWSIVWQDLYRHDKDNLDISSMDRSPRLAVDERFRTSPGSSRGIAEIHDVPAQALDRLTDVVSGSVDALDPEFRAFDFSLVHSVRQILTAAFPREDTTRFFGSGRIEAPEVDRSYDLATLEGTRILRSLYEDLSFDRNTTSSVDRMLEWLPRMTDEIRRESAYHSFVSRERMDWVLSAPSVYQAWWSRIEEPRRIASKAPAIDADDLDAFARVP